MREQDCAICRRKGWPVLEGCDEANEETAWRSDGVAGEETAEIENVERIAEVFAVGLDSRCEAVGVVERCGGRSIQQQRRKNAAAIEIQATEHLRSVLREDGGGVAVEFKGQAGVVLCTSF